jgi:hypothetical protein
MFEDLMSPVAAAVSLLTPLAHEYEIRPAAGASPGIHCSKAAMIIETPPAPACAASPRRIIPPHSATPRR